ncbi:MAG: SLOG family protein [Acutalibacteraceae bacterium]|nr:SLOG family protein [Acutalibacteraceae bacterium]
MQNKLHTCCFTGHRAIPEDDLDRLKLELNDTLVSLIENGISYFRAGGALGFDTICAQTVLSLKKIYPHIKLTLVLPCLNQTAKWQQEDKDVYEDIKSKADEVVYTSEHYFRGCMQVRNRALVDESSVAVCYLTQINGGTAYTVKYAQKNGLTIVNLADKQKKIDM